MELLLSLFGLFLKPWFAAGLIALLSTLGLAFRRLRVIRNSGSASSKSKQKRSSNHQELITGAILQVVPIHPHNGWRLEGMWHGLRVFSRSFPALPPHQPHPHGHTPSPSPSSSSLTTPSLAASVIINYPPKRAVSLAVSTKELGCWLEGVTPQGIQVLSQDSSGDVLKLTQHKGRLELLQQVRKRAMRFIEKYASFLDGWVAPPTEVTMETIERSWRRDEQFSYIFLEPRQPSSLPFSWAFFMFNALKEQGICLATLVMMPSQQNEEANSLVAKQLCSLREHATLKSLGVYSTSHQTTPTPSTHNLRPARANKSHDNTGTDDNHAPRRRKPRSQRIVSEPAIFEQTREISHPKPHPQVPRPLHVTSEPSLSTLGNPPTAVLDAKYFQVAEASAQKLVAAADGREREGWMVVGTTKDVNVMKKPAGKGEPPINSVKGVGLIKAPPTFIIRFLNDPSYTTVLDDMLKESRIIYDLSKSLHLVQLLYKGVWPTAPRDFSVLSIQGEVDERTWISSGISVEDPRIPEEKGYVRAQLDVGGYLIRSVPSEPEVSEVTYVARVDLKGNIPAFAVNKISQSQPLCVNRLRGLVEPLYAKMKEEPQKMKEFEEKFTIATVVPRKPAPVALTLMEGSAHGDAGREEAGEDAGETREDSTGRSKTTNKDSKASLNDEEASLAETARALSRGESKGGKIKEAIVGAGEEGERGAAGGGGDTRETRKNSDHTLPATADTSKEATGEEGAGGGEGEGEGDLDSTVVISMSDLHPTDTLHLPSKAKLVQQPNANSLFSVGEGEEREEEDQYSLHDSWNGELLETYTPEQLPSDPEEEGEGGEMKSERERMDSANSNVFVNKPSPALQLKLPNYQRVRDSIASTDDNVETQSLTKDTINYPMLNHGGVDFKTMANQTAAKALEEAFHASGINPLDPSTFTDQSNGWRFAGYEKNVVILSKKTDESPYTSFMGKGVIDLPPQTVFDSIRNPQLRFTYDNMLKELHIVKQVDEGLYILHLHHQTTQCFVKTSRDFCILVSERSEPNKMLLVGTSIDVPECPPTPNIHRGRIFCSGWIVEPYRGSSSTQITYMLQVDVGGLPSGLVNFVSKRQPLAVAYLRDYLVSTSLDLSTKESSNTSSTSSYS